MKTKKKRRKSKPQAPKHEVVKISRVQKKAGPKDDGSSNFRYSDSFRRAPHFATWLVTLALVASLGAVTAWKMQKTEIIPEDDVDTKKVQEKLELHGQLAELRKHKNRSLTIIVGTSLTQAAFFSDRSSSREAAKLGYPNMDFLRIDQNGPLIVHRLIPLFDKLLIAKPDAVIIENQVLTWHNQKRRENFFVTHRKFMLSGIRSIFGATQKNSIFVDPHLEAQMKWQDHFDNFKNWSGKKQKARMEQLQSRQELFKLQMRRNKWSTCPAEVPEPLDNFLKKANETGVPVALLNIATSKEATEVVPSDFRECQERLDAQYQKDYGVKFLSSPNDMDLSHFMDFCHFNRRGRIAFTKWFLPLLKDMIEEGKAK